MSDQTKNSTSKEAALTSPLGMGGIIGGAGYTAQDRYIACHAPYWIFREGFTKIWPEGTGDVDVYFENLPEPYAEHIQVKDYDHNLTPGELKGIVEGFIAFDNEERAVFYRKYTIATPSLNSDVVTLYNRLKRWRDAPQHAITSLEIRDLDDSIAKVGLSDHADWIKEKLHFHSGLHDLSDDATCFDRFTGTLSNQFASQAEYQLRLLPGSRGAYDRLLGHIRSTQGQTTDSAQLRQILELAFGLGTSEEGVNLVIHNWEVDSQDFGGQLVHEFDWTEHFDREVSPRSVPSAAVWNGTLLPELRQLKRDLRASKAPQFIRFRGRCSLSTGFAVGAIFPQTGGWTIETPQPDLQHLWRTNPPVSRNYQLVVRHLGGSDGFPLDANSSNLLVIASITQAGTANVERWLKSNGESSPAFKAVLDVQPHGGVGSGSIKGASDAVNFALALREVIKEQNGAQGTDAVHLFYNGPQALSVMLGHWLTSVGTVQLYEFLQPGFAPACTLQT